MNENTINSLRQALAVSPGNIPLRIHLAETLISMNRVDEAEEEYAEIIRQGDPVTGQQGIARVAFEKGDYSKCNVILEELVNQGNDSFNILLLHARALLREQSISQAIDIYKQILERNPDFHDEELDSQLRVNAAGSEAEDQDDMGLEMIQRPSIDFSDVGGMDQVKKEIDLKIIKPLQHPELYKAYGKKIGGGILLYGPPGCGKTHIARATAGQVNAHFISVSLNDILDMWIGNSEKNLHEVFEIARENTPCVLFFDEIDALGASRSDMKQSSGRHLINQFLQELDGMENDNEGVLILGATNTPWHLDTAFRRPGRFDRIIFVPPPDEAAREAIFKLKLKGKPAEGINYALLAKKSKDFSGADIEAAVDIAIEEKLEAAFEDGIPKPLTNRDLQQAIKRHKSSISEWFTAARNFALYANESGLYDDILTYLKIKK
ncbi:MAG: ATP-binding protein [Bacteroidia bacterium]